MKPVPMIFAFPFRVGYPGESLVETFLGVYADDVQPQVLVVAQHVLELVLAQQAVIHEHAGQVAPDGFVQQHGGYRRVHAPRQGQHHFVIAQFFLQFLDGGLYERGGRPVARSPADVEEVAQQPRAVERVEHFGVELHAPCRLAFHAISGKVHVLRAGYLAETCGQARDGVAVRHPYLRAGRDAPEQRVAAVDVGQVGAAVFARVGRLHVAPRRVGHELRPVADAQHGECAAYAPQVGFERRRVVHGVGAAGEDDPLHVAGVGGELVVGNDFAVLV